MPDGNLEHKGRAGAAAQAPPPTRLSAIPGWTLWLLGRDQAGLVASLILICIIFSILSPYFLLPANGINIARGNAFAAVAAAITTLVLVGGGLDLSIGAVMAFVGIVCAQLLLLDVPWFLVIGIGLGIGAGIGLLNGLIVTYVGINPFIVTIGTQFVVRGAAFLGVSNHELTVTEPHFLFIGQGNVFGIPFSALLALAVFGVVAWWLHFTKFGKHIYAVGGTPGGLMARLAGIPINRRRMQIYILSGTFAGLAGIMLDGFTGAGIAYAATGIELTVISAVILGGTALMGGRGTVFGTFLGVMLLAIINNGIVLLDVSTYWQYVVQGAALLIAVTIDEVRIKRAAR